MVVKLDLKSAASETKKPIRAQIGDNLLLVFLTITFMFLCILCTGIYSFYEIIQTDIEITRTKTSIAEQRTSCIKIKKELDSFYKRIEQSDCLYNFILDGTPTYEIYALLVSQNDNCVSFDNVLISNQMLNVNGTADKQEYAVYLAQQLTKHNIVSSEALPNCKVADIAVNDEKLVSYTISAPISNLKTVLDSNVIASLINILSDANDI